MSALRLGHACQVDGTAAPTLFELPAHHLVTHGVVVGMTGSGKTGLLTVMVEEAIGAGVPVLVIDVKGDLPNLLLAFPSLDVAEVRPWAESTRGPNDTRTPDEIAAALAAQRRRGLGAWGIGEAELRAWHGRTDVRVLTPGSTAGESLHLLSSLERRSPRWDSDLESARATLSAAISLVLRLLGRDPDPAKSREHVLLSVLAERRLLAGEPAELGALLGDVLEPPLEMIGALPLDEFVSKTDRKTLAAALNTLLASPTFASWRQGATLDVGEWLSARDGRTPAAILSVAHLDDEERALVLGVVLEEVLSWVRTLPGSQRLRALVVFDEVYGFLPPHPANPPTKRPLVALMKQARAFGVGVVIATQNPMDLDYRALGNAGLWCVGRLQTDADRERVVDGLATSGAAGDARALGKLVQRLSERWFVVRDVHTEGEPVLMQPRWAMSLMRGPMTRSELQQACAAREAAEAGG
jgi:hypothetical protein